VGSGRGCCPERAPSSHTVIGLQSADAAAYAQRFRGDTFRRQAASCRWALQQHQGTPSSTLAVLFAIHPLPLTWRRHPGCVDADASCTQAGNLEACQYCRRLEGCWQPWHSSYKQHIVAVVGVTGSARHAHQQAPPAAAWHLPVGSASVSGSVRFSTFPGGRLEASRTRGKLPAEKKHNKQDAAP
jgi:hypothetical protein